MQELVWNPDPSTGPIEAKGVRERPFTVHHAEREVPGILWEPTSTKAAGLVLIGHGASANKRTPHLVALARRFVRRHGVAAAAIDGPIHGDRGPGEENQRLFGVHWRKPGVTEAMIEDWRATLDGLCAAGLSDVPVGYWGLSMGTIFGLPYVAADRRIGAAVLGLLGSKGPTSTHIRTAAEKLACPVLFIVQWDDELFPREQTLDLFGRLGSRDKRLHVNVGRHAQVPLHEYDFSREFLAQQLLAD